METAELSVIPEKNKDEQPEFRVILPLEFKVPEGVTTYYATQLVAQEAENEVYLYFFDSPPPLLMGTHDEIKKHVEKLTTLPAVCVARIVINKNRWGAFHRVLEKHLTIKETTDNPKKADK